MMLFMDPLAPAYQAAPLTRSYAVASADTPTPSDGYPSLLVDLNNDHAESLAVDWIVWLQDVRHLAVNTLKSYNAVLRSYLEWCDKVGLDPLHPGLADLEAFMTRRHSYNGRKGSASSQRTDVAVLRGWFTWMLNRGLVTSNPTFGFTGPPAKRKDGRPIEDEHWQTLWASDMPLRMRAILGLGFYCGLREGEIGSLRTDQLTDTRVRNFVRKGGGEDTLPWADMAEVHHRKLPHLLPDPELLHRSVAHVRHNYERLIPWQRDRELYRWLRKACDRVDIPRYTPHQMRHSAATNLLRAGVKPHVVMRLLNHTSFDTTMGYVRAGARDLQEFLDTM